MQDQALVDLVFGCFENSRYHTVNPLAISHVGPSILNQDLHFIDQAYLSRLRAIPATFEPTSQPASNAHSLDHSRCRPTS